MDDDLPNARTKNFAWTHFHVGTRGLAQL